jgi:hypothetical protein
MPSEEASDHDVNNRTGIPLTYQYVCDVISQISAER